MALVLIKDFMIYNDDYINSIADLIEEGYSKVELIRIIMKDLKYKQQSQAMLVILDAIEMLENDLEEGVQDLAWIVSQRENYENDLNELLKRN